MIRDPWRTTRRGVVVTAAAVLLVVCAVCWPRDTITLTGLGGSLILSGWALVTGIRMLRTERRAKRHPADCAGCAGCGGPDCIQRPDAEDDDLTAQEARDLAEDLGLQLYRAQDALAFVAEMCDIADEHRGRRGQPATVTTARVREWLRGAQCARQAGLVLTPDASGQHPETARTNPDTTEPHAADQGGHHPDSIRTPTYAGITSTQPSPAPPWATLAQAIAALPPATPAPHPDRSRRDRIAAALRARLKLATVLRTEPPYGQIGSLLAATEYDLADTALAELAPELERLGTAEAALAEVIAVAEVIDANGIQWAADSIRRAAKGSDR